MQDFRRLLVWQRAHAFAIDLHRATDTFPRFGYAEVKTQLRRASDSIASNIVEGSAEATRKEFARFLDIGIKSCSEVDYQLQLARDLGVLSHDRWKPLACEVVEIRKMLWGLRRTLLVALDGRTTRGTTKPDDTDDNSDDR